MQGEPRQSLGVHWVGQLPLQSLELTYLLCSLESLRAKRPVQPAPRQTPEAWFRTMQRKPNLRACLNSLPCADQDSRRQAGKHWRSNLVRGFIHWWSWIHTRKDTCAANFVFAGVAVLRAWTQHIYRNWFSKIPWDFTSQLDGENMKTSHLPDPGGLKTLTTVFPTMGVICLPKKNLKERKERSLNISSTEWN